MIIIFIMKHHEPNNKQGDRPSRAIIDPFLSPRVIPTQIIFKATSRGRGFFHGAQSRPASEARVIRWSQMDPKFGSQ